MKLIVALFALLNSADAFVAPGAAVAKPKKGIATAARLKGYTVGSLAPPGSVSSGTIAQYGYGIDNRYGGRAKAMKSPAAASSGESKGNVAVVSGILVAAVAAVGYYAQTAGA